MKTSDFARRNWPGRSALAALIGAVIWNPVRSQVNQPAADFHPVDLSMSYSRKSDTFEAGTAWSAVPWGRQRLDGIPFRLGGILELTGMGAAGDGWVYPGGYTGIRVARKAEWIHLLHGTGYDEKDGVAIARLTLNYENGEKRSLGIRYGVHVRNWWVEKHEEVAAVADPNSEVAWTGTSRQTDPAGVTLRLFHSSLQNPMPDQLIQSVDFSSLFRRATTVIVAMTVGKAGNARPVSNAAPALAKVETEEPLEEAGFRAETLFHLQDTASGRPVANARLRVNVENEKGSYFFGQQSTDAKGTTSLAYPTSLFTRLTLAVMAPDYATLFHNTSILDLKKDVVLKLARGISVGGLVKDPVGRPVADAKVVVSAVARDEAGQFVLSEYDTAASDASGKWSSSSLPADFKSLSLEVTHPRFMPTEFEQAESDDPADKKFSRESLLAGRALLVVEPGIAVEGKIADSAGRPVAE